MDAETGSPLSNVAPCVAAGAGVEGATWWAVSGDSLYGSEAVVVSPPFTPTPYDDAPTDDDGLH